MTELTYRQRASRNWRWYVVGLYCIVCVPFFMLQLALWVVNRTFQFAADSADNAWDALEVFAQRFMMGPLEWFNKSMEPKEKE